MGLPVAKVVDCAYIIIFFAGFQGGKYFLNNRFQELAFAATLALFIYGATKLAVNQGRLRRRAAACCKKGRRAKRGSLRPWAMPSNFSISQRPTRLPMAQLATREKRDPTEQSVSTRVSSQSCSRSPLVAT